MFKHLSIGLVVLLPACLLLHPRISDEKGEVIRLVEKEIRRTTMPMRDSLAISRMSMDLAFDHMNSLEDLDMLNNGKLAWFDYAWISKKTGHQAYTGLVVVDTTTMLVITHRKYE